MLRTHTCGELRKIDIGKKAKLCGWVQSYRDHGGVIFIDLRDRYGLTQIVFDPSHEKDSHKIAESLRREFVIQAEGKIRFRGEGLVNPNMVTGEIEVLADSVNILSKSETPPIEIDDRKIAGEEQRLKYRYLDLRRPQMQKSLEIRHKAFKAAMDYLDSQGFLHVETPMLMKSTPEGARDYVVPSRVNMGKFYALPQSPQLYKQILMVAGIDRYFQLARCLRDEDLRADRQPEHTQIDIEMSFVEREDVFDIVEGLMKAILKVIGVGIKTPFPRISWKEAMEKYGSDKPDLRFGLELGDVTELMKSSDFQIYKDVIMNKGIVKVLRVPGGAAFSRNDIDSLIELAKTHHAKGMSWMKIKEGKAESSITKYFSEELLKKLIKDTGAKDNDILLFIADKFERAASALGQIRLEIAKKQNLIKDDWKFAWIIDFPLFEWNEDEQKWDPMHHMFCAPKEEDIPKLEKKPGEVLCNQYDLTLNGVELCSGSIRITDPEIQKKVMKIVGFSQEEAEKRFGFLLEAFKYGAPPHGGVGIGFDRVVALLIGNNDIREVIAFPKNKNAENLMDGSPSDITERQMKELHLKHDFVKKH
jgi:aspartyl-tRNA synthetase